MKEQKPLIIIKPDGMVKSLTGNVISKLSETKLGLLINFNSKLLKSNIHRVVNNL